MVIDSHQHFWEYSSERHAWISDEMTVLQRDFLPDDLKLILNQNQVDGCVAVQASQTEEETDFLHQLSTDHDFIKGVVGWVDLRSAMIEERLEHYSTYDKLVGFRHIIQDEPDPNFMSQSDFKRGISTLEAFGFSYDILIKPAQIDASLQLVASFPNQKFVLDHLAKPYIQGQKIDDWKTAMKKMATHENVMCKLSGMVTEAHWNAWTVEDFKPYLDVVFEVFGSKRLMYGSDWPVCLLSSSYADMKTIITAYINNLSATEKQDIMGLNAINFYHLNGVK